MTFSYIKRQDPRGSIFFQQISVRMVVYHLTKSDQIRQLTSEFWRAIKTRQISKWNTGQISDTDFKTRSQPHRARTEFCLGFVVFHTHPTCSGTLHPHPHPIPAQVNRAIKVSTFDTCDYAVGLGLQHHRNH